MQDSELKVSDVVRETLDLLLQRREASLDALAQQLQVLRVAPHSLPGTIHRPDEFEPKRRYGELRLLLGEQWPELGFYDAATLGPVTESSEEVGDDLDDLADLVGELETTLELAVTSERDALSWLRFTADIHWGDHADLLIRHLGVLVKADPARK